MKDLISRELRQKIADLRLISQDSFVKAHPKVWPTTYIGQSYMEGFHAAIKAVLDTLSTTPPNKEGERGEKDLAKVLNDLIDELPVDWLGTGGLGSKPDRDAAEWRKRWDAALSTRGKDAVELLNWLGNEDLKMYAKGWCQLGGSNGLYLSSEDLYQLFLKR